MNKLFFIIPVYKVEEYLKRCVDSVLNQTYGGCVTVLVDDGSPDSCPGICDEYASEYSNIYVIHKENGGLADARNAGLDCALESADNGDFVTFLDSDDFVSEDFAGKMLDLCNKNSCAVAQCGYEKGSGNAFGAPVKEPETFALGAGDALLGYRLKSMSCAKVYKVSCLRDLRFRTGVINEDEFFTYRAVYAGGKTAFTSEKLYYYYQRDKSIMSIVAKNLKNNPRRFDFIKAYEERIEFFKAKNEPLQVLKTHEKICTDIFLRYCEQMQLPRSERDNECVDGTYMKMYRKNFKIMIKRKGIPLKRRAIYNMFYIMPRAVAAAGRVLSFRK